MTNEHHLDRIRFRNNRTFGKDTCVPGWKWNQIVPFPDYALWFVVSGRGEVWANQHYFLLGKGSCLIMRPGELHVATQSERHRLTNIFVHFSVLDAATGLDIHPLELLPRCSVLKDAHFAESLLHRLLDVLEYDEESKDAEFQTIMRLLFIHLLRPQEEANQDTGLTWHQEMNIKKVISHIRLEDGRLIDYRELSRISNMSPQYLNRLFKQFTGLPLKQFIIRTKLERATYLLAETAMSISEIADTLGYSDIYSFSKFFKLFKGMSPSHYRHSLRNPLKAPAPAGSGE
ncbi:MAG: helix-turn-helix transcriptional regulator [Paenibacillaceae bacterium]|nr:helix-turn-helix transcriptional regulator [Paenibacillaceae bacterium]